MQMGTRERGLARLLSSYPEEESHSQVIKEDQSEYAENQEHSAA